MQPIQLYPSTHPKLQLQAALVAALLCLPVGLHTEQAAAATNSAGALTTTNGPAGSLFRWPTANRSRAASVLAWLGGGKTNLPSGLFPGSAPRQPSQRMILAEVGPNSRSWRAEPDASAGAVTNRLGLARQGAAPHVVAIETGMNYWDGQQWSPSDASFDLTEDAFVAERVQHRTRLNADLNVVGAVTTMLVDGTTLRSTPVAIGLYDPNNGRFAVLASVTNSVGVLVATNCVVYSNAFQGSVCANVVYTLHKGSFHQDVVITGRLNPVEYSFPTNAQIQAITEFYDPPQPETLRRPLYVEQNAVVRQRMVSPDMTDEVLGFSDLVFGTGRAFTPPSATDTNGTHTVVAKEWRTVPEEGRIFLIETVCCPLIQKALDALPDCGSGSGTGQLLPRGSAQEGYAVIPRPGQGAQAKAKPRRSATQLAQANAPARPGVVIDYEATLSGSLSGTITFKGDTTYLVEGTVYCNGPVTLEAAVFKYQSGATLKLNNSLTCKTSSYRPAVFTCVDDDSIGESLATVEGSGWTGNINPAGYANPALWAYFVSVPGLSNARFCYAQEALRSEGAYVTGTLANSQILNCIRGIVLVTAAAGTGSGSGGFNLTVNNALISFVQSALVRSAEYGSGSSVLAYPYLYNCTLDHVQVLANDANSGTFVVQFRNSILANVTNLGNALLTSSTYNGFYASPLFGTTANRWTSQTSPFQTSGAGAYYLQPASVFRGIGTTTGLPSTLLPSLKTKTTQPPVVFVAFTAITDQLSLFPQPQVPRYATGPPDLGYWYDALDYTITYVAAAGGAINIEPGTTIAVVGQPGYVETGFTVWENGSLVGHGTPDKPIIFADARYVQEGPGLLPQPWEIAFLPDFEGDYYFDRPPLLSFRFCTFSFPAEAGLVCSGGYSGISETLDASFYWSLQDCRVQGGWIDVTRNHPMGIASPPGALNWINTSFERVNATICPTWWFVYDYPFADLDFPVHLYNNLFRGGSLTVQGSPTSQGNWAVRDNLFDGATLYNDPNLPLDHDYNAYWQTTPLAPNNTDGGVDGQHNQTLTSAPGYQSGGAFGDFYLPAGTLNADAGRTTSQAGLSQYTMSVNQPYDGANVRIGLHYVVAQNGLPKASLVSGVPDYVSDADGDGVVDSTVTSPPPSFALATRANNDVFQAAQGGSAIQLTVLANDTDSQGLPLTVFYPYLSFTTSHGGTVAQSSDLQSLLYTPPAGFHGIDTFTYGIVNDFNRESSGTATVFVSATGNDAPAAGSYHATLGTSQTSIDVALVNDTDADNNPLTLYSIGTPQLGTAVEGTPQSGHRVITYSRAASVYGTDTFTYVTTDGNGGCAVGTIEVDRAAGGSYAPTAVSYTTTATMGAPLNFTLVASDPNGESLTYTVLQGPLHGTLEIQGQSDPLNIPPGGTTVPSPNLVYTPDEWYYGSDVVTFKVNNGTFDSSTATIGFRVGYLNAPPIANALSVFTHTGTAVPVNLSGWAPDCDYLYFSQPGAPAHGTLSGTPPSLTYTPATGYSGWDSFSFIVNDGKEDSAPATVTISVDAPAPAGNPIANADLFQVDQNSTTTLDVLGNDTDSEGYALKVATPSAPTATTAGGSVTRAPDALSLLYTTPSATYYGVDTFTYTVDNGHGQTANGAVRVFVNRTGNNPPTASDYNVTLPAGTHTTTINFSTLLASPYCTDPDLNTLSLDSIGQPTKGTASVNGGTGQIVYTRDAAKFGNDSFQYVVTDGNGGLASAWIIIEQEDTDGNGIPDEWELLHFQDTGVDPSADPDGDGLPNLVEYMLHTDPNIQDSPLNLDSLANQQVSGLVTMPIPLDTGVESPPPVLLYVDGEQAADSFFDKEADGHWVLNWNTVFLRSGWHWIALGVPYAPSPGSDSTQTALGPEVPVLVANAVTFSRLTSRFTDSFHIDAALAGRNTSYRVDLFDESGNALVCATGAATDWRIHLDWDLTDGVGSQLAFGNIYAKVTVLPPSAIPVASSGGFRPTELASPAADNNQVPVVWEWFPKEVASGPGNKFAIAWGWDRYQLAFLNRVNSMMLDGVVNILGNVQDPYSYTLTPAANYPQVMTFRFDNGVDRQALLSALAQSDCFFWLGHGGGVSAISGNPEHADIGPQDVCAKLQNYGWESTPKHPRSDNHQYKLAIIAGCQTYGQTWANAFAIPWDPEGTGMVAEYRAVGRKPRALVGWTANIVVPFGYDADVYEGVPCTVYGQALGQLFSKWMEGFPLEYCLDYFTEQALAYKPAGYTYFSGADSWKISGCVDLTR